MPSFVYNAKDAAGKNTSGVVEARSEKDAAVLLRQRNLFPTKISRTESKSLLSLPKLFNHVSFNEIVTFTQQLSSMFIAGLQLPDALQILQAQTTNPMFLSVLQKISADVQGGGSLSDAISKYPHLFPPLYISLIKAGESSGTLDKVLVRLAHNLEVDREFRGKVKGALIYPVIVVIAMLLVVGVLMIFVIPQISQLYGDFGFDLPFSTRMLIGMSDILVAFWWMIPFVIGGAVYGFNAFARTPVGKLALDRLVLKLPVFGKLITQIILVEFTRTLGLLISAGIHLLDGLAILTESMSNQVFYQALKTISTKVEKGMPLGAAFSQATMFPLIVGQMVKVGEETGKLDESLTNLANYFEGESNNTVKGLTLAIEPLIMVFLGVGVGFIVISIITPIYNLTSQIK